MKIKVTIKTILTLIIILLITANFNIVQANIQVASGAGRGSASSRPAHRPDHRTG